MHITIDNLSDAAAAPDYPGEIAKPPALFEQLLRSIPPEKAKQVLVWIDEAGDDCAVMETLLSILNGDAI